MLAVPVGARDPRPVFVATHGNFDRPEWQCEVWSQIVRGRAFVLCPRGAARRDSPGPDDVRFTYNDNKQLEREVDAALASLWSSPYATHLAPGPVVWAGFSLGAIMGVAIAARRPADFPVLVLIEGGVDRMTAQNVAALAKGGARAVMLACAQAGCAGSARGAQRRLEQAGLTVLVVDAGRVGHTYDGPVAKAVARELPALLAGDPRFLSVFAD